MYFGLANTCFEFIRGFHSLCSLTGGRSIRRWMHLCGPMCDFSTPFHGTGFGQTRIVMSSIPAELAISDPSGLNATLRM